MDLFSSLITVFLIISLGILCYKKKVFSNQHIEGFELLLFKIILPSYLFVASYKHNLSALLNIRFTLAYITSFIILAYIVIWFFKKKVPKENLYIRILGSGYINTSRYALPVITVLLDNPLSGVLANIIQVTLIQPFFIIALNNARYQDKPFLKKMLKALSSPMTLAPIIGITCNYINISLPDSIVDSFSELGNSAAGIALFAFGLTLGATKITRKCLNIDLISIVLCKNLIHPFLAIAIGTLFCLEDYWFNSLLITASTPTAFVVYLIARQFQTEEEIIKKVIALTSIISSISLIFITLFISKS